MAKKRHLYNGGEPDDDELYASSSVYKPLPDINIIADKPAWQQGLTNYDWARARQYYSNPDGTINSRGLMFLKDVASKRRTGTSDFMRDVNKLAAIPNAAMLAAGSFSGAFSNPYLWSVAGLASAAQNVEDKNYKAAARDAALTLLPVPVINGTTKVAKRIIPKLAKSYRRLTSPLPSRTDLINEHGLASKIAGEHYTPTTQTHKDNETIKLGIDRYKYAAQDSYTTYKGRILTSDEIKQLKEIENLSPEYIQFVNERPDLHPLSQEALDAFIDRQSLSVRGIYAENKPDSQSSLTLARKYLTTPSRNPSDRLENRGLYTSNGRYIADKFMRPEHIGFTPQDSYQGVVRYDFNIDRTKPIKDQLRQYRAKVNNYDWDLESPTMEMIESKYVRGNGLKSEDIYERSINPKYENIYEEIPVVDIADVQMKGTNLENLHGRWGFNTSDAHSDNDLFIPKQASRDRREFINFAKRLINSNTVNTITWPKEYHDYMQQLEEVFIRQNSKRRVLINELERKQRHLYDGLDRFYSNAPGLMVLAGLGLGFGGLAVAGEKAKPKRHNRNISTTKNDKERTGHSSTWFEENGTPAQQILLLPSMLKGGNIKNGGSVRRRLESNGNLSY